MVQLLNSHAVKQALDFTETRKISVHIEPSYQDIGKHMMWIINHLYSTTANKELVVQKESLNFLATRKKLTCSRANHTSSACTPRNDKTMQVLQLKNVKQQQG